LAFGLVVAAGLSTTLGSTFVFCSSYANTKILAGALGVSAGVMLYVSFVEIFAIKSVEGFSAAYGDRGSTYATLCFFGGILATTLLDAAVHAIGRYQRDARCDDGASDGGSDGGCGHDDAHGVCVAAGMQRIRTHDLTLTNRKFGGKSPKHANDPAEMLAGERALWSDAAKVTQEEQEACKAISDVEQGAVGSSASSTTSVGGTPLKRPNDVTESGELDGGFANAPNSASFAHASQIELLTSDRVKHGVTHEVDTPDKELLKNMGAMTALAIALHNFPEGLATFVAAMADTKLGLALAVAVAVHNIPEGACVAMPVYYATGSKMKGFWWSFVSGVSEPIGGLFGYLVLYGNAMSDVAYGALFGVVGGMMVYISLKELLPTALKYDPHDKYVTNCTFAGMAIMALSLILFQI
jgi:ZIP family zinc transporter